MEASAVEPLPTEDSVANLYVGYHNSQNQIAATGEFLGAAQTLGYDVTTIPLTTEHFQSRVLATLTSHVEKLRSVASPAAVPPPTISTLLPEDSVLTPADHNVSLVGVVSPWIDLGSPDPLIAHVSRQVLALEVGYAAFCGVNNLLLHGPVDGSNVTHYARALLDALSMGPYIQLHVLLPITGELELDGHISTHLSELASDYYPGELDDDVDAESNLYGSWDMWNSIRTICGYTSKLGIALELPRNLPATDIQSRWYSEPIRMLVLPRTSFLRNAKGYPVLSKPHQQLLTRFLRLRFPPWALLADVDEIHLPTGNTAAPNPTPPEAAGRAMEKPKDRTAHLSYLRHLQQTQPGRPPIERFGQGYQDYIQSPLQPLTDNLESITYEVFERDPIKYEWYERAVAAALQDLYAMLGRPIIVAVVGAGRGPLVTRVLLASQKTSIQVICCAVEKNPNAHLLIQRRNATDPLWDKRVLIYHSDMRSWQGPTIDGDERPREVDILVSELLGSFADNELSPECLDGVQHVLNVEHGVSIPQSYSAHLTPIATPKLHADLSNRPADMSQWEIPAVVMLHQFDYLCNLRGTSNPTGKEAIIPDVQEVWRFDHPISRTYLEATKSNGAMAGERKTSHNVRSSTLCFTANDRGVCHGLAGYFETVLYAPSSGQTPIELSTNPVTMEQKSKDMISWFPIFFPLKIPLYIPDQAEIEVHMWRQTDGRMVWYEWMLEVFAKFDKVAGAGTLGNMRTKRTKIGASELHSSRKSGCLM